MDLIQSFPYEPTYLAESQFQRHHYIKRHFVTFQIKEKLATVTVKEYRNI